MGKPHYKPRILELSTHRIALVGQRIVFLNLMLNQQFSLLWFSQLALCLLPRSPKNKSVHQTGSKQKPALRCCQVANELLYIAAGTTVVLLLPTSKAPLSPSTLQSLNATQATLRGLQ